MWSVSFVCVLEILIKYSRNSNERNSIVCDAAKYNMILLPPKQYKTTYCGWQLGEVQTLSTVCACVSCKMLNVTRGTAETVTYYSDAVCNLRAWSTCVFALNILCSTSSFYTSRNMLLVDKTCCKFCDTTSFRTRAIIHSAVTFRYTAILCYRMCDYSHLCNHLVFVLYPWMKRISLKSEKLRGAGKTEIKPELTEEHH